MAAFRAVLKGCAVAAAAATGLGFVHPMYFISVGYGLSMLGQAVATLWLRRSALDLPATLHCALMAAYGIRLAAFILWRNTLPSYQAQLAGIDQRTSRLTAAAKAGMWAACSALYVAMFAPAVYSSMRPASGRPSTAVLTNVTLALGAIGVVWEAVADVQQQLHYEAQAAPAGPSKQPRDKVPQPAATAARREGSIKGQQPAASGARLPCMRGLFRLSRHANYFGELLVWWASYLAGSRGYQAPADWLMSAVGTAFIAFIIASESKRRDKSRQEHYGGHAQWVAYTNRTPQLLPLLGRRGRQAVGGCGVQAWFGPGVEQLVQLRTGNHPLSHDEMT